MLTYRVKDQKRGPKNYKFDCVLGESVSQDDVFEQSGASSLVDRVVAVSSLIRRVTMQQFLRTVRLEVARHTLWRAQVTTKI